MTDRRTGPERLVGKYFHATTLCELDFRRYVWTGRILACVTPELFLVDHRERLRLESAIPGQEIITLDQFRALHPLLYDNVRDLRSALGKNGELGHDCDDPDHRDHDRGPVAHMFLPRFYPVPAWMLERPDE
jgi:hypothetical protein